MVQEKPPVDGCIVKLFFLKLASPELVIARVRQRVREGGHNIPEPVIRRRFASGLGTFENLCKPLVDEWALYETIPQANLFSSKKE